MEYLKEFVPDLLTKLTLVGNLILILGALYLIIRPLSKLSFVKNLATYFQNKSLEWIAVVSFVATSGSLFYSDVMGYNPCRLCWYQRIFMYPIFILAIVGIYKKDINATNYILPMAIIGALIATYHYLMQRGAVPAGDCAIVGYSESCASTFFLEYGYITIPVMALTAFLLIIGLIIIQRRKN